MASFSVSEAALTGFRVVWQRPKAAAVWLGLALLISFSFGLFTTSTVGPAFTRFMQFEATADMAKADPVQVMSLAAPLAPVYSVLLVFALLFYPVLYAAMNRAALRPREEGFGYLRLGGDELRQVALLLGYTGMFLVAYFLLTIVVALVVVLGAAGQSSLGVVALLIQAILIVGIVCGAAVLAVRLSLASALTYATKRINFFGSWALTRGQFWPILGSYLMALALAAVVWLLVFAVALSAAGIAGGGGNPFDLVFTVDMTSPATYFTPSRIAYLVLSALSQALIWPLLLTPAPAIYRRLAPAHGLPTGADGSITDVFA